MLCTMVQGAGDALPHEALIVLEPFPLSASTHLLFAATGLLLGPRQRAVDRPVVLQNLLVLLRPQLTESLDVRVQHLGEERQEEVELSHRAVDLALHAIAVHLGCGLVLLWLWLRLLLGALHRLLKRAVESLALYGVHPAG